MKKKLIKCIVFVIMQLSIGDLDANATLAEPLQNAPNPFLWEHGTTIVYSQSQKDIHPVKLSLYTMMGRRVLTKIYPSSNKIGTNNNKQQIHVSKQDVLGVSLAKGVYFYILTSGGKSLGKGKMAII
jgi:hypothetical protein